MFYTGATRLFCKSKDLKNKEQLTDIKIYIGNQPPNYLGYIKN